MLMLNYQNRAGLSGLVERMALYLFRRVWTN